MATVRLSFSPHPARVRTARLLGVALGRRCGLPEEIVDEVRLAVGEACSRAVAVHAKLGSSGHVQVQFTDDEHRFEARVEDEGDPAAVHEPDHGPADGAVTGDPAAVGAGEGGELALPSGLGLSIAAGLVDDFEVRPVATGGTVVVLAWKR
jgi:anti-sigma regulatory factor (Ser/Thr protein kinase)